MSFAIDRCNRPPGTHWGRSSQQRSSSDAWEGLQHALQADAGQHIMGLPDRTASEKPAGEQQVIEQWFLGLIKACLPEVL
jgi:hypothetical protein